MRHCTPSKFLKRWPGSLHPIVFPEPGPKLPKDCRRMLTKFGMPRELTIYCYNDLSLRFSGSATPLAAIWERDSKKGYKLGELPSGWARFWHLADQEYVQGSNYICVEEETGRLVVINLGLRDPIYLMNSSVGNFYTTLAHLLEWSERTGGSPEETVLLRDALNCQQCISPEELKPFWMDGIIYTLDSDPMRNFVVALGPKDAEPGAAADGGGSTAFPGS